MQFGSSARVGKFGFALLFTLFGTFTSFAQFDQYGQPLSGQSQQSCNPNDPSCQPAPGQNNIPVPNTPNNQQQYGNSLTNFPGQLGNQNNQSTNQQTGSQTEQQRLLNGNIQIPQPPEPPTEFQLMVANSLGKTLPIYGAKLFRNPPSTFAPLNLVPVTPDYVIGPGDELLIQAWGQVTLNGRFTVDRAGGLYIPQVGTLHVAGLKFAQIQDYLKAQMGRVFRNFDLNVNMGQLRSIEVFVVGQ